MKVLQINGDDRSFLNFRYAWSSTMRARGIEIVVAAPDTGSGNEIVKRGFRFFPFSLHRGSLNPFSLWATAGAIKRIVRDVRPNVVQAFSLKVSLLASLASIGARPECEIYIFTGMGTLFSSKNPLLLVLRYLFLFTAKLLFRHGTVYVMNQEDLALVERWSLGRDRRLVASEGVDLEKFPFAPITKKKISRIAFVGRFLKAKGFLMLTDAFGELQKKHGSAELHLYGGIDKENSNSITESQLEQLRRDPGIFYHGYTTDVAAALRDVDAIVLPTVYREGLPATLLEAAAVGRICIASDISACKELIDDRETGFLVRKGSRESLEEILSYVMANELPLEQMARKARAKVEARYSCAAVATGWERAFRATRAEGSRE